MRRELIEKHLADPTQKVHVLRVGDLLVQTAAIEAVKLSLIETVTEFHRLNPLVAGMSKEALREKLGVGPEVFDLTLNRLVGDKKLEVIGEFVRLPGHSVIMKDEEAESKKMIESAFASAGLKVPALKDVLSGLKVDSTRAQKIVTLLLRDKVLIKISEELVFHRDALEGLRKRMAMQKATTPKMDVSSFKDLTGVSRKYAIPLLEYLDREHVTRRVGDERIIL
jgi:selenocysteine-specific elongation factor